MASSTDPSTWTDFTTAVTNSAINSAEGLGFVIGGAAVEKQIVGVDIDGCWNSETEELAPWAEKLVDLLNSYAEITPSKKGIRVWVIGEWPFKEHVFKLDPQAGFGDKVQIEVYNTGRYFTVTGDSIYEGKVPVEGRNLTAVYDLCLEIQSQHPPKSKINTTPSTSGKVDGAQIQQTSSVITTKLELLMRGNVASVQPFVIEDGRGNSLEFPSHSEADLALCTQLALKHGDNVDLIWNDYLQSSLRRDKWVNREDYFKDNTIAKAIKTAQEINQAVAKEKADIAVSDSPLNDTEEVFEYDMTPEEMAEQDAAEYPVRKLKVSAGPHFDESILYGPVGEVAKKISKYNESHIAATYLNLLVSLGNIFGRGPHFTINKTTHYLIEFLACVGDSSTARKGQGSDEVNAFLSLFANDWLENCNPSGFGSGQGIIYQIRDDVTFQTPVKSKGVVTGYRDVTKKGVADKRLCLREDELSGLFKLAAKSEDKTDELIRRAWDGKKLSNLVAGKTEIGESNSLVCREPMISIVGYTTPSLAKSTLVAGADTSGFGNRFLWCHIRRLQLAPFGGPDIDWGSEMLTHKNQTVSFPIYFYNMVKEAQKNRLIPLATSARKFYQNLYDRVERPRRGFVARMTSRGAPHIRRLATILCLVDSEDAVRVEHLKAAEAIWNYCVESTRYIFVGYTQEQASVLRLARSKDIISLTDVHDLFDRHKTADWIKAQLRGLVVDGYLTTSNNTWRLKRMPEEPK